MSCMKSLPFDAEIEEVGVALRVKGEGGGENAGRGRAYPSTPRSRR